jgi:hypothetical protein
MRDPIAQVAELEARERLFHDLGCFPPAQSHNQGEEDEGKGHVAARNRQSVSR